MSNSVLKNKNPKPAKIKNDLKKIREQQEKFSLGVEESNFYESSLFNKAYLKNDLKNKTFWALEQNSEFLVFKEKLSNLVDQRSGDKFEVWSESDTIHNWIVPVMEALGWQISPRHKPFLEQTSFVVTEDGKPKTYLPDLLYVDSEKEKKYIAQEKKDPEAKIREAKQRVQVVLEAKYWGRIKDAENQKKLDKKRADSQRKGEPRFSSADAQTLKYMKILDKDWGIATDGKTWRLLHKTDSSTSNHRSFEFRLGNLFDHVNYNLQDCDPSKLDNFDAAIKYFYAFFSKPSLVSEDDSEKFVDEVLRYSRKYVSKAEEDLKDRFVDAMKYSCNGYYRAAKKEKLKLELVDIRNISESHLFNILFIRNCEMKGVLPLNSVNYSKISLSKMIDLIDGARFDPEVEKELNYKQLKKMFSESYFFEKKTFKWTGSELYDGLVRLTKVINKGSSHNGEDFGFKIHGFRESVFSKEDCQIASKAKLNNEEMVNILHQLCFIESEFKSKKFQQIPYNAFSPRQLGSIYESFLEYQIDQAPHDMIYKKKGKAKSWQKADLRLKKNLKYPSVKKKELFFTPDNKERKATGSYYTPDYIVQYIVKETLGPLVKGKSSKEILKLKVCDPAMGSGHFLSGALEFLTEAYLKAFDSELTEGELLSFPEAKRVVLDSSIYGMDINPRAVKLAKMSLWLESAYQGNKLERLDDQLVNIDSLSIATKDIKHRYSAIVGNPPWGASVASVPTHLYPRGITKPRLHESFVDFIFLSLRLIHSGGKAGIIIPNVLFYQNDFSGVREYLAGAKMMSRVIDLGDNRFKNVIAASGILMLGKGKSSIYFGAEDRNEESINCSFHDISFDRLTKSNDFVFITSDSKEQRLIEAAFKANHTIGDELSLINSGVCTGCDNAFTTKSSDLKSSIIKLDLLKSCLRGRHIHKFYVDQKCSEFLVYTERSVKSVPKVIENLLAGFRDRLSGRSEVKKGTYKWFGLNRPRSKEYFEKNKILIRQTGDSLVGVFDQKGFYSLNSTLVLQLTDPTDLNYYFLVGLLNSEFYNRLYQFLCKEKGRAFAEVKPNIVKRLPFPIWASLETKKEIAFLSESLHSENDLVKHKTLNILVEKLFKNRQKGREKAA